MDTKNEMLTEQTNELFLEDLHRNLQQMRIFLADNYNISLDMRKLLLDILIAFLDAPISAIDDNEGELLCLFLELEDRTMDSETDELIKELKYKIKRAIRPKSKIIRGRDNTDLYSNKRDEDGYITDFSLMVPPYKTSRIEHKTGDILHFTEEIYEDSMGRFFRKIYEYHNEETEESVAADILSSFDE